MRVETCEQVLCGRGELLCDGMTLDTVDSEYVSERQLLALNACARAEWPLPSASS